MSECKIYFVDVILFFVFFNEFIYWVFFELNEYIQFFVRVVVFFGKGKLYIVIVICIYEEVLIVYQVKYVEYILDDFFIIIVV